MFSAMTISVTHINAPLPTWLHVSYSVNINMPLGRTRTTQIEETFEDNTQARICLNDNVDPVQESDRWHAYNQSCGIGSEFSSTRIAAIYFYKILPTIRRSIVASNLERGSAASTPRASVPFVKKYILNMI